MIHCTKINNSARGTLFHLLKAILLMACCWLTPHQTQAQTALKWASYVPQDYNMTISAMHFDENNDRLFLAGNWNSPNNQPTHIYGIGSSNDIAILCLSSDGSTLHWSASLGGSGGESVSAISTNEVGDVFIVGSTGSADYPVDGTVAPFGVSGNIIVSRLSAAGDTLMYSTRINGSLTGSKSVVVEGDNVYWGGLMSSFGPDLPTTANAFQTTKGPLQRSAGLFSLNTSVPGEAGMNWATYFAGTMENGLSTIKMGPDGQLVIGGFVRAYLPGQLNYFPLTDNALQTIEDVLALPGFIYNQTTVGQFVAKFTTSGELTYSTLLYTYAGFGGDYRLHMDLDVDKDGNIYTIKSFLGTSTTVNTLEAIPSNQLTVFASNLSDPIIICKIPADLSPTLDYMSVYGGNGWTLGRSLIEVDGKNRAHLFMRTNVGGSSGFFPTAGSLPPTPVATYLNTEQVYGILSASGASIDYMSNLAGSPTTSGLLTVKESGEAYVQETVTTSFPYTPSFYDAASGTQKFVMNPNPSGTIPSGVFAFHEPIPNDGNTITDFPSGTNTFCINGLIYQDPNDGPIYGDSASYSSGDGSLPIHNLPDLMIPATGQTIAHTIPAIHRLKYQWEKSYDGSSWETILGADLEVLKPEPEPAAATVQYRRLLITASCDTVTISNIATANIVGDFKLQINATSDPVYFCQGTAKDMGINITGASGNISWQWYNGFDPMTTEIIPASGSNFAEGDFTATLAATATEGGSYRLIVTDAGGCKKEAFVTTVSLTASASEEGNIVLCPGDTPSALLGPSAVNPVFDYSWTGPGGFTSTDPNPRVSTAGTYTLQVKLKTDAIFCTPGATTVTVTGLTNHAAVLGAIGDTEFCQSDSPAPIGLSGVAPSGYVFQWVPGVNLDNAQAFSPTFDPGSLPFNAYPISTVDYTFTALRLSDGCIFETTTRVADTARALAQAGIDKPASSCNSPATQSFGAPETDGLYWEWRAVGTTYPGDVAALSSHSDFLMDGSNTNLGTNKFLTAQFPYHTACYTIDYEIKASYVPFPTNCFTRDTVRLFYCPGCEGDGGDWCTDLTSNAMGTDGACSGTGSIISGHALGGLTYTWTTYSVNDVVQPANTAPQGLFEINADGTKGAPLVAGAAHPAEAIADFDDTAWGWSGSNVVIYRLRANGNFGTGEIDCHRDIQIFSAADATPVIGVTDKAFCEIQAPAVRLGTTGNAPPYTLTGIDYTEAPNSAFDWEWTGSDDSNSTITSGGTTPFPTIEPFLSTDYEVVVTDPVTGCIAKDTLSAMITRVFAVAGEDISAVCDGALVQLGGTPQINHTYSWSPTAGLNAPIGTANSTVANPYLLVNGNLTYTVTVTETTTGCQATDEMTVSTTTAAPPAPPTTSTFLGCPSAVFTIGPDEYTTPYVTYNWTVESGSADIAWLDATGVLNPSVTLPADFSSNAIFRLTVSRGTCPTSSQTYTISHSPPQLNLPASVSYNCSAATVTLATGSTYNAAYTYQWTPVEGLYTNSAGTTPYLGGNYIYGYNIYASPNTTTTYTVTVINVVTGCSATEDIIVNVPGTVTADAGSDFSYCPGDAVAISASGTGTSYAWTATGYHSDPYANVNPGGPNAAMLSYLSSTTTLNPTFSQAVYTPGKYVYTLTATDNGCSTSDEVTVIAVNLPNVNLAEASFSICEGQSVQLEVVTPSIQLNYSWGVVNPGAQIVSINDPNSPNPMVNPTETTTYELTYFDILTGCSNSDIIVTVDVAPKPVVADIDMPVECAPLSVAVDLTAQIPSYNSYFNQVWYQNSAPGTLINTPTAVNPTATTNYYVVLENEFACKDTARVTTNIDAPQTPNIIPTVLMNCNAPTIDLAAYQGSPSNVLNTLEWHSVDNTMAASLLGSTIVRAGTYYLFERSPNDCVSASGVLTARQDNCPISCFEITELIADRFICSGELVDTLAVTTTFINPDSIAFVYFNSAQTDPYSGGTGIDTVQVTSSSDTAMLTDISGFTHAGGSTPDTFYVYGIAYPTPTDASCRPFEEILVQVNPCDWGDLADISATTNMDDYQTLRANNGPVHIIIPGH